MNNESTRATTAPDLKPCPHCGDTDIAMHPNDIATRGAEMSNPGSDVNYAHCDGCGADGPQAFTESEARDLWNRRAPFPSTGGELATSSTGRELLGYFAFHDGAWHQSNAGDPCSIKLWGDPKAALLAASEPAPVARDLPPLPEMLSLADIPAAQETPESWDADYRETWQKLQVADCNRRQWRAYALELRAALAQAAAESAPMCWQCGINPRKEACGGPKTCTRTAESAPASAAPREAEDSQRLDFMATHEAWVAWSRDGERCRVFHRDEDGDTRPLMGWVPAAWADSAREAIDKAQRNRHE